MKRSRYFSDIFQNYAAEIDDLVTDSEGKSVLQKRLGEKRREMDAILPMIEFSPEMVSVVFYGAFGFKSLDAMQRIVLSEPGDADFPEWAVLENELTVTEWAKPLIEASLKAQGGDPFLVTTAALEFLRSKDTVSVPAPESETDKDRNDEAEEDNEDEMGDLNEAGADWLAEQGFDPLDR